MTPQYVLHTLMHCTYYTVSLTCTVHVLYTVSRDVLQGVGMTCVLTVMIADHVSTRSKPLLSD